MAKKKNATDKCPEGTCPDEASSLKILERRGLAAGLLEGASCVCLLDHGASLQIDVKASGSNPTPIWGSRVAWGCIFGNVVLYFGIAPDTTGQEGRWYFISSPYGECFTCVVFNPRELSTAEAVGYWTAEDDGIVSEEEDLDCGRLARGLESAGAHQRDPLSYEIDQASIVGVAKKYLQYPDGKFAENAMVTVSGSRLKISVQNTDLENVIGTFDWFPGLLPIDQMWAGYLGRGTSNFFVASIVEQEQELTLNFLFFQRESDPVCGSWRATRPTS